MAARTNDTTLQNKGKYIVYICSHNQTKQDATDSLIEWSGKNVNTH